MTDNTQEENQRQRKWKKIGRVCSSIKKKIPSVQWFSHKRRWYVVKHILIIGIIVSLFCVLYIHHLNSESNIFSFISNLSLNFSFILIPTFLYLIEVRRNFKNEFDDIFYLKNDLLYLRRFIANEISGTKNVKHRDIIIDPSNVDQIVKLLRKFKFDKHATLLLTYIEMKRLYNIDLIITDVIKKIKKYDSGKDYKSIETNWEFKNAMETIEELEKKYNTERLRKLFLDDLTYPLAYYLLSDKPNKAAAYYYDILKIYPNVTYQKLINAILDILKYNIESEGIETQVFDIDIVNAIKLLDRNKKDLRDLGMYFNFNTEKSEAVLIILNEPCDVLKVNIKMDKTFQVNSRYDTGLEENKKWVKDNMISHLKKFIEDYNLRIPDEEFWNN